VSADLMRGGRVRSRRWHAADCLFCGRTVKQGQGYVQIEARNYMRFAPIPLRFLGYWYAHKQCWRRRHDYQT